MGLLMTCYVIWLISAFAATLMRDPYLLALCLGAMLSFAILIAAWVLGGGGE